MNKFLGIILLAILTLILIIDYFPNFIPFSMNNMTIIIFLLVLIVVSFVYGRKQTKRNQLKEVFYFQLIGPIYIIFLLLILTFLGGETQNGVSLTSFIFWVVMIIAFVEVYRTHKEIKKLEMIERTQIT